MRSIGIIATNRRSRDRHLRRRSGCTSEAHPFPLSMRPSAAILRISNSRSESRESAVPVLLFIAMRADSFIAGSERMSNKITAIRCRCVGHDHTGDGRQSASSMHRRYREVHDPGHFRSGGDERRRNQNSAFDRESHAPKALSGTSVQLRGHPRRRSGRRRMAQRQL